MRSRPSTSADEADRIERVARRRHRVGTGLFVAAVAVVGVLALAAAGTAAADGSAEIDESTVAVTDGGTETIVVDSDGVESFEVAIGDEDESGYELRATVTPDCDGETVLTYDHGEAGVGSDPLTAAGAEVEVGGETDLGKSPASGAYDVRLFVGDGNDSADVGTLLVEISGESGDDGTGDGDAVEAVDATDVEDADVLVEPRATVVTVPVELDDGAAVEMRLRSAGNASTNFIKTQGATVTDGEATATFDASVAEPGDRATLAVRGNEALDEPVTRDVLVVEDVDSPESDDTDDEAPGFGPVVAALALLGAAFVARVRG